MKVRTDRAALADALGWVARVVPKSPSVAALGGIRVTATEAGLSLRGYDYDTAHRADLDAEVGDPGECLVPGLFLRDAVAGGRGTDVELVLDGNRLTITSGRSTYRMQTLKADDYPTLPDFPPTVGTLPHGDLSYALGAVLAAVDDANPTEGLRGLRLEASGGHLELTGLDRPRVHTVALAWDGEPFGVTVNARDFAAAAKGMSGTITLGASDSLLGLSDGSHTVTARVASVAFANWRQAVTVANQRATSKLTVDGTDLLAAVKQAGALVPDGVPVVLDFEGGELTVSTGQEVGEGSEVLPAEGDNPASLRFTPRYLSDALAATTGGKVELGYDKAGGPMLIKDPAWDGLTLVVMGRTVA